MAAYGRLLGRMSGLNMMLIDTLPGLCWYRGDLVTGAEVVVQKSTNLQLVYFVSLVLCKTFDPKNQDDLDVFTYLRDQLNISFQNYSVQKCTMINCFLLLQSETFSSKLTLFQNICSKLIRFYRDGLYEKLELVPEPLSFSIRECPWTNTPVDVIWSCFQVICAYINCILSKLHRNSRNFLWFTIGNSAQ